MRILKSPSRPGPAPHTAFPRHRCSCLIFKTLQWIKLITSLAKLFYPLVVPPSGNSSAQRMPHVGLWLSSLTSETVNHPLNSTLSGTWEWRKYLRSLMHSLEFQNWTAILGSEKDGPAVETCLKIMSWRKQAFRLSECESKWAPPFWRAMWTYILTVLNVCIPFNGIIHVYGRVLSELSEGCAMAFICECL